MPRIAIIGLGLIGGSLGLALKKAELKELEIVGHDAEWGVNGRAKKLGAIDKGAKHPGAAVEGAALVVIATPILQMRDVLEQIAPELAEGAVVTDTGSTKRDVIRWADELLPDSVSFVGGHPIAGKEQTGLDGADAELFQGRPWALSASVGATESAVKSIEYLTTVVGAHPVLVDAEEHDSYLAAVSHLPLMTSVALFTLASGSQAWPDLAALAGPGFRSATRLASGSPDMSHDIALTNRENLLHWLDRYGEELRKLRELIANEEKQDELITLLAKARTERDAFIESPPERPGATQTMEMASSGERMLSLMIGEHLARRTREINEALERRASGGGGPRGKRGGR